MKNLGISVTAGLVLWFYPLAPSGVSTQAWQLLSIFVATIIGIITQPLPLGAVAMLGLGAAMVTKTLTFAQAFSAFSSEIPCVHHSLRDSCHTAFIHIVLAPGMLGVHHARGPVCQQFGELHQRNCCYMHDLLAPVTP
jgi:di/tricarboxylate transporter